MTAKTLYNRPEDHTYLDVPITDRHHAFLISEMMRFLGLARNDLVVELGAGSGRYTQLLRAAGLQVLAFEPDPFFAAKIKEHFANDDGVSVVQGLLTTTAEVPDCCRAVVGFHVLHHLNSDHLRELRLTIDNQNDHPAFKGWLFLEPNPLNVLWYLLILIIKGQTFREEKGMWVNDYDKHLGYGTSVCQGDFGFFPPRQAIKGIADRWCRLFGVIDGRKSPFRIYRLFGQVKE